jgi:hypothetical protein
MAQYFRVTIGTQLITTFRVVYSTELTPTVFDHTAEIYDESSNSYSTATGLTYDQLTDNGGAIVRTDDDVYQLKIEDENNYCTDCVSSIFGIPAPGILLETIEPSGTGTTYQNVNGSLTSYAGESRRLLFEYTSDDGPEGDFQISNIYFASNTADYDSRYNNNFQTSRDQESQYSSVTWYTIDGSSTGGRWVMGGGSTPTSGTGINTDNYKTTFTYQGRAYYGRAITPYSTYQGQTSGYVRTRTVTTTITSTYFNPKYYFYYTETSGNGYGYPDKKFWLRSPVKTIPATGGYYSFDYGGFGSDMGVLKVWLV